MSALSPGAGYVLNIPTVDRKDPADCPAAAVVSPAQLFRAERGAEKEQAATGGALAAFALAEAELGTQVVFPEMVDIESPDLPYHLTDGGGGKSRPGPG